jgi:hypothetical protein
MAARRMVAIIVIVKPPVIDLPIALATRPR